MPTFTPPTVTEAPAGTGRLFTRYKIPRGISVVKQNGHYVQDRFPWAGDLEALTEGIDYFLGGRSYVVSAATTTALQADGFHVAPDFTLTTPPIASVITATSGTSFSFAPFTPTAGALIIVLMGDTPDVGTSTYSISDTAGMPWSWVVAPQGNIGGSSRNHSAAYFIGVAPANPVSTTITVTTSGQTAAIGLQIGVLTGYTGVPQGAWQGVTTAATQSGCRLTFATPPVGSSIVLAAVTWNNAPTASADGGLVGLGQVDANVNNHVESFIKLGNCPQQITLTATGSLATSAVAIEITAAT